jgi:hypothetical protein
LEHKKPDDDFDENKLFYTRNILPAFLLERDSGKGSKIYLINSS